MAIKFFSTVVAAPGTPQLLTANTTPAGAAISMLGETSTSGVASAASTLTLTAAPGNTAGKYVYVGGSTLSVANKTAIGLALAPGASVVLPFGNGEFGLGVIWFDTDATTANTEKLFVTAIG